MKHILTVVFIAHWTAHWWTIAACPEQEHQINPYTGERPPTMAIEAVACAEEHIRVMQKEFSTRSEAEYFLNECPDSNLLTGPANPICTKKEIEENDN